MVVGLHRWLVEEESRGGAGRPESMERTPCLVSNVMTGGQGAYHSCNVFVYAVAACCIRKEVKL